MVRTPKVKTERGKRLKKSSQCEDDEVIATIGETETEAMVLAVSPGELGVDDEEDEAPDDVTLTTGKIQALERERNEVEAMKRLNSSKKEKRRQKDELYKQQKESKLSRHLKAFPEEDLKEAVSKLAEIRKSERQNQKTHPKSSEEQLDCSEVSEARVGRVKVLTSTAIGSKEEDYKQKEVLEFLQNHFYGGTQGRVPILSQRSKRRRLRGRPALNFTTA